MILVDFTKEVDAAIAEAESLQQVTITLWG